MPAQGTIWQVQPTCVYPFSLNSGVSLSDCIPILPISSTNFPSLLDGENTHSRPPSRIRRIGQKIPLMYTSPASTSTTVVQMHAQPRRGQSVAVAVAPPAPSSRTSLVVGFLACLILYAFNGTESLNLNLNMNIDYETYYNQYEYIYTSSVEMVPSSFYNVDLSSLPSLSAAIKAVQDTYGPGSGWGRTLLGESTATSSSSSSTPSPPPKAASSPAAGSHSHTSKNDMDTNQEGKAQFYNLALSTEENYEYSEEVFTGRYKTIRQSLDYTYHQNYLPQRQLLQDTIIAHILSKQYANITDSNGNSCVSPKNPWIVFTAGAMGSGKSYTIRHLAAQDRFPLESFVTVDPDEIRRLLPEFELYLEHDSEMAGEKTRKEAGFIAEMLTQIALKAGRNVLVDGSLNDAEWYQDYFDILRQDYDHVGLRIGILHITAPREAVFERSRVSAICMDYVVLMIPYSPWIKVLRFLM
jgi:predicted kinase